jgi:hypothetical protein
MHSAGEHQDKFFIWGMILLPILSLCAYIFDAFYYYYTLHQSSSSIYEGLLSTIVIVFSYLQYCAPIKSRRLLFAYHVLLWVLVEIGHIGYILSFTHSGKKFSIVIFVGWMICDTLFTSGLLYCRVYRRLDYNIEVENKHIFHFISRLEVILAIFIPVFLSRNFSTITRDNIAFFLLFDFFSEKYERFSGAWIKSCLYLFVAVVTAAVATEWLYFSFNDHTFEYITDISELVAACFCDTLIIMQFYTFHFKPNYLKDIVREVQVINANDKPITAA